MDLMTEIISVLEEVKPGWKDTARAVKLLNVLKRIRIVETEFLPDLIGDVTDLNPAQCYVYFFAHHEDYDIRNDKTIQWQALKYATSQLQNHDNDLKLFLENYKFDNLDKERNLRDLLSRLWKRQEQRRFLIDNLKPPVDDGLGPEPKMPRLR